MVGEDPPASRVVEAASYVSVFNSRFGKNSKQRSTARQEEPRAPGARIDAATAHPRPHPAARPFNVSREAVLRGREDDDRAKV